MLKTTEILLPYSTTYLPIHIPEQQLAFVADLPAVAVKQNWQADLLAALAKPIGSAPLVDLLNPGDRIVILVEDNTRHTPVIPILEQLYAYLQQHGISLNQLEILIAPGTHRVMTADELLTKLGPYTMQHLRVSQHDYRDTGALIKLDDVYVGEMAVPVEVNRKVLEADFVLGIGNIIPHPNAGFSGGAKILDPGVCGKATVSATHTAAALLGYLPLGVMENACRASLEEVARRAGLRFVINVVLDSENRVIEVVAGDPVLAHRKGAEAARQVYGIPLREPVDVVIACSYPYDIDFWQCEKALISAYFAVKPGGAIILLAPCLEGLAHNHDDLLDWAGYSYQEAAEIVKQIDPLDARYDLVSAGIAMGATLVREKADIYIVSENLSGEQVKRLGYHQFPDAQKALAAILAEQPAAKIGILKRGGDCFPYIIA